MPRRLPLFLLLLAAAPDQAALPPSIERAFAETKAAMMSEPSRAMRGAHRALALAQALPPSRRARLAVATALWLDGEAHLFLHQRAAAEPQIAAALATVTREAPGTKLEGDLMRSKGAIAEDAGRMQEALAAYQRAFAIFTVAREERSRAMALQDMGRIYRSAGDLERTLRFYEQSAEIYHEDPVLLLTNHNSRGELLWELGRYAQAEGHFQKAFAAARARQHHFASARAHQSCRNPSRRAQARRGASDGHPRARAVAR